LADGAGIPFPVAPVLAACVAAAVGVVVGVPALRIRGAQLAVVTLAAAVALEQLVFRNPKLTGTGGSLIPDASLFGLDLGSRKGTDIARLPFGLLVLAVLAGSALVVSNLIRSATGRRLLAVRSNERAAAAVGIDVASNKLLAFAIASFLAGLGGAFIGYSRGQLSAESFSTLVGLSFLAFAYLGGITSVAGALVAGTLAPLGIGFVVLDRQLELGDRYLLLSGVALVLTSIFNAEGIVGRAWSRRPPPSPAPADDVVMVPTAPAAPRVPRSDALVVLDAADIAVSYGGVRAVDGLSFTVRHGEVVGLIGPNGAGKTSLIDAVTGFTSHGGTVHLDGVAVHALAPHRRARAGLRRTWQSIELFGDLTVRENVAVAGDRPSVRSIARDLLRPGTGASGADADAVEVALARMGLIAVADQFPSSLPLGVQKLVGVARACAGDPAVVLLDEPAAGLDSDESRELGARLRALASSGVGLLLVDHDMGLVLDTCDRVYVVDFGRLIAAGTPAEIVREPDVVAAYLGSAVVA
jgi:ABC-type branched-subunit amino acid transport system ATPase component/ABC-type branched-subunit amino acid transport system permease subunit